MSDSTVHHPPPVITRYVAPVPTGATVSINWHVSDEDFDAIHAACAPDSAVEHYDATAQRSAFRSTKFELEGQVITLFGRDMRDTATATVTAVTV